MPFVLVLFALESSSTCKEYACCCDVLHVSSGGLPLTPQHHDWLHSSAKDAWKRAGETALTVGSDSLKLTIRRRTPTSVKGELVNFRDLYLTVYDARQLH